MFEKPEEVCDVIDSLQIRNWSILYRTNQLIQKIIFVKDTGDGKIPREIKAFGCWYSKKGNILSGNKSGSSGWKLGNDLRYQYHCKTKGCAQRIDLVRRINSDGVIDEWRVNCVKAHSTKCRNVFGTAYQPKEKKRKIDQQYCVMDIEASMNKPICEIPLSSPQHNQHHIPESVGNTDLFKPSIDIVPEKDSKIISENREKKSKRKSNRKRKRNESCIKDGDENAKSFVEESLHLAKAYESAKKRGVDFVVLPKNVETFFNPPLETRSQNIVPISQVFDIKENRNRKSFEESFLNGIGEDSDFEKVILAPITNDEISGIEMERINFDVVEEEEEEEEEDQILYKVPSVKEFNVDSYIKEYKGNESIRKIYGFFNKDEALIK